MKPTLKQAAVLKCFKGNDEYTIRQLAALSGRNHNSVETMVYGLLAKGFIVRGEDIIKESNNRRTYTYKLKNNIDDELAKFKSDEPHYRFVPYKQEQIAVHHEVPKAAKTTHILPDKQGEDKGNYLKQSQFNRKAKKNRREAMINHCSLNRL